MDYQEAKRLLHPETTRDAIWEIADKQDAFKKINEACLIACEAIDELQALHNQGFSLERLKDIDFRKEVVEHINYKNYLSVKDDLEDYQQIGTLEEVAEYKRFYDDIAPKTEDELIDLVEYRKIGTLEEVREAVEKWNECKNCGYKIHSEGISKLNSCNDCGLANTCVKRPEYGEYCRINCYDWRKRNER